MIRAMAIRTYGDPEWSAPMAKAIEPRKPSEAVRRVAMHQHTPEEWAAMTVAARDSYSKLHRPRGRLYGAILGAWALMWLRIFGWYAYLSAWNREA